MANAIIYLRFVCVVNERLSELTESIRLRAFTDTNWDDHVVFRSNGGEISRLY